MALDATPGGTAANSYLDDAAFLDYVAGALDASAATGAEEATRERALRHATRLIDRLSFLGEATEDAQALAWPRELLLDPDRPRLQLSATAIPRRVREACGELALGLLREGAAPDAGLADGAIYKRAKVDVLEVEFRDGVASGTDAVGVLRRYPAVLSLLAPFLSGGGVLEVVRA